MRTIKSGATLAGSNYVTPVDGRLCLWSRRNHVHSLLFSRARTGQLDAAIPSVVSSVVCLSCTSSILMFGGCVVVVTYATRNLRTCEHTH